MTAGRGQGQLGPEGGRGAGAQEGAHGVQQSQVHREIVSAVTS